MPLPVQAARTLAWVHAAGGVLLIFVTALSSGAISAAETLATYCCALILGASAFFFEHGGNGIRTTAVVVTAVSVLIGLIGLGHPYPTGLLGLAASIAILALLFHPGAVTWFRRPAADRTHPEPAPNRWLHTIGDLAPEFPRRLRDTRLPQPAHRRRSQAGRVVPAARRRWEARRRH
ncbi:hypothetical protein [Nocardia sp. alder85J]|uniref:hypothetical protein n=1 Tax=Nocardia sp. alder85J TaxID=2862949 RepID=UPI001CD3BA21|nr:hypothetical protein [Nocardia sp. alder85J]MCX4092811.1 hypothetical protein [Nocardia sp. alder85J]